MAKDKQQLAFEEFVSKLPTGVLPDADHDRDWPTCPECKGTGKRYESPGHGIFGLREGPCRRCWGATKIPWSAVDAHECIAEEWDSLIPVASAW